MFRFALLTSTLLLASSLSAQEATLRAGASQSGTLSAGDTVRYALPAEADFFVMGEVAQAGVDLVVRIMDPDGRQMRRFDQVSQGAERFAFEISDGGAHELQLFVRDEGEGSFTLSIERLEPLESDPAKLVDQLMAPYDRPDAPGAAISVFRDGRTLFSRAYGMANLSYGVPFEVDTRTNIGSTSKQFTAFAIMLLVERGQLSLDDDIRTHVPELPEFEHTITVRNILNHTSGLREFINLLLMTGRQMGDNIDRSELIDVVQRQPALQNVPGDEFNYNNTAFGLAALIVERISEQPFHEFMRDEVFGPLGMNDTFVRPSPSAIIENRSEGYTPSRDGTYMEIGDIAGAVGAGSIYSTLGDLQTWIENYMSPSVGNASSVEEMMTASTLNDGSSSGYGLGLFIDEQGGLVRVHHGGADVAHRSMLVYYPEIGAGATAQSNDAGFNSNVAFRVAEAFFADAMESDVPAAEDGVAFDPASYDAADFDDYAGRYELDAVPGFVLTFSREDETLYLQATGQPRIEIVPTSDSTFALTVVEASVAFHRDAEGKVEAATLNQGGAQRATRIEESAEEAWAPDADDLAEFVGRYFSEEIETFFDVSLSEDHLVASQRRMGEMDMTPNEVDTFGASMFTLTFERDRNGQLIAFYLSNGRSRDVRFEKMD